LKPTPLVHHVAQADYDMADLAIEMNYESARRVLRATSSARQTSPVLLLARWA
jgi:hypothetical protein